MKNDETESLRQRLKDEKRSKACERAKLSQERAKLRKWNSEDNVRKVVRDWLRKRYNDKQTKFLMSKPEREEIIGMYYVLHSLLLNTMVQYPIFIEKICIFGLISYAWTMYRLVSVRLLIPTMKLFYFLKRQPS